MLLMLCNASVYATSTESNTAAVAAPSAPKLRGIANGRVITLTWNAVEGADGYEVYYYKKSTKKYHRIKVIHDGNIQTISMNGKFNSRYFYRIKAFKKQANTRIRSKYSNQAGVKTAASPAVKLIKVTSPKKLQVKLEWEKNKYADGYQVFRAKGKNGTSVKIKTLQSADITSFVDDTVKEGFTYYYRVRTYRKNADTMAYGEFSEVKCAESARRVVFIGASRTEMLHSDVGDRTNIWLHKVSMGYSWMASTAVPMMEAYLDGKTDICIWLGTNDVYQVNNYIKYLNQKIPQWKQKGAKVYIVAVGPVVVDPYVTNEEIVAFNKAMKKGIQGEEYLDLYTYLNKNGFCAVDGVHYDSATNKKIYSYLKEKMNLK